MVLKRDFYYGALIINLIKEGFAPAIIENKEEYQVYELASDHGDYYVFAKYRSGGSGSTWRFQLTNNDQIQLKKHAEKNNKKLLIALICGAEKLQDSEIVYLTYAELQQIVQFQNSLVNFSIRAKKGSHTYSLYKGKYDAKREFLITRNRKERLKELI